MAVVRLKARTARTLPIGVTSLAGCQVQIVYVLYTFPSRSASVKRCWVVSQFEFWERFMKNLALSAQSLLESALKQPLGGRPQFKIQK